jgi:ubiquitin-protein ligase
MEDSKAEEKKGLAAEAEVAAREEIKISVEHSDMTEEMQEQLKEMVRDAFMKHTVYKDLATHVKQVFDAKYPPPDNKATSGVYHCVVGE